MSASPPAPRMLGLEALLTADLAYGLIIRAHEVAKEGRQAEALHTLAALAGAVATERPVLRGVISAQRQAAEMLNLTESPAVRVLCSIGKAAEQPHASNDKPHAPSPLQPSDGVA